MGIALTYLSLGWSGIFESLNDHLLNYLEGGDFDELIGKFCTERRELSAFLAFRMRDPTSPDFLGSKRVDNELVNVMQRDYLTPQSNPVIAALPYAIPGRLLHKTELVSPEHFDSQGVYEHFVRPSNTDHFGTALYKGQSGLFMFTLGHHSQYDWMSEEVSRYTSHSLGQIVRAVDLRLRMEIGATSDQCILLLDEDKFVRVLDDQHRGKVEQWFKIANNRLLPRMKRDVPQFEKGLGKAFQGQQFSCTLSGSADERMSLTFSPGPKFPYGKTVTLELNKLQRPNWDVASLCSTFNLTLSEANVTEDLLNGLEVRGIAEKRGLKQDTVRAYLKRIYAKTEVHGQARLIKHLLT